MHLGVPVQFQTPIPSSMYRAQSRRYSAWVVRSISSCAWKKSVAHMQAGGVPMAVPVSCFQKVSENWNTLFLMIRERASMRCCGR